MSPFPSTGIERTAAFSAAIASQRASPAYICAAVRACSATAAHPSSSAMRPVAR
jgi:hypothetical protein